MNDKSSLLRSYLVSALLQRHTLEFVQSFLNEYEHQIEKAIHKSQQLEISAESIDLIAEPFD